MTQATSLKDGNSKDDSSPFGESGDISDALENIFDSAIKKFVDKYKGSSKIREKDFDILASAYMIEHRGYSHPVYIFKIMRLETIPTKVSRTAMFRIYTPPHTLFTSKDLTKIDLDNFLHMFTFFEAVSLHLLSLTEASTLDQYISLQRHYIKISLGDRLALIADAYTDKTGKKYINNLRSNILQVRNQVAHSLNPLRVTYKNDDYDIDDSTLMHYVKDDMNNAMNALMTPYLASQQKLIKWLSPDDGLGYADIINEIKGAKK